MSKFLPTNRFKWIDPKVFDLNKYTSNSSKGCVLEVDLKYPKELRELHNDYPLAPDKMKSKEKFCLTTNQKLVKFCLTTNQKLLIFITSLLAMLKN